ncbi:Cytochrome c oxidase subunit 6B-like protein new16 [Schizosaccharomyces pombe]
MAGNGALRRSAREKCWEARDAYFGCLDRHSILDGLKDDTKAAQACPAEKTAFETDCVKSWVNYFLKFRVQQHQQQEAIKKLEAQGAKKLN